MILIWLAVIATGLVVAVRSSQIAVRHALAIAERLEVPPFLLGVTLMAFGTDLPEVANSIVASVTGHGDVNVGDSVGSAATQATLVIGLLPWIARRSIPVSRRHVRLLGGLTVAALGLTVVLVVDGALNRIDAALLLSAWVGSMVLLARTNPPSRQEGLAAPGRSAVASGLVAVLALIFVALGAITAVTGLVRLAAVVGVPEYIVSFLALALGTSLPELAVCITAIRRGQPGMALGDALGSSLADATLSIGIGPLIAPIAVSVSLAVRGGLFAVVAVAVATMTLVRVGKLGRLAGAWLIAIYLTGYLVLLAF